MAKTYYQGKPGNPLVAYYSVTTRGALAILFAVGLVLSGLLLMRQWARYFLNRKLVLTYLFFAFIPLVCTVIIFVMGVRALFGISSANTVENTIESLGNDLWKFSNTILENSMERINTQDVLEWEYILPDLIKAARDGELRRHRVSDIVVDVYYQPLGSQVGTDQLVICMNCDTFWNEGRLEGKQGYLMLSHDDFQDICPDWLQANTSVTMVQRGDGIYVQTFIKRTFSQGTLIVKSAIPVNTAFLDHIREILDINIALSHVNGNWTYQTDMAPGSWLLRLLLKPLRTTWEIRALDWESGFARPLATMEFEIDANSIIEEFRPKRMMTVFGRDQKRLHFKIILGFVFALILAEIAALILGIYLVGTITRSLTLIAAGHEKVGMSNLDYRLPDLGKDQLGAMGRSFNAMVSNIESLLAQMREKEKYQEELRIAREIQMSLLPNTQHMRWSKSIAATCIPARQVGGDYFDIFDTPEDRIGIFIADVSGKGTSAAFYMAELKGVLIALKSFWDRPKQLMCEINEILYPALRANVFISAAYLLIDPQSREAQLVRAGHCPAIHLQPDGQSRDLLPPGMAIGLARNDVFGKIIQCEPLRLGERDKVVLYTDGLDEMSFHGELYGIERLKQVLRRHAAATSTEIKEKVLDDVLSFLAAGEQDDDLTLVVASVPSDHERQSTRVGRQASVTLGH